MTVRRERTCKGILQILYWYVKNSFRWRGGDFLCAEKIKKIVTRKKISKKGEKRL